jgi:hypothetical protein
MWRLDPLCGAGGFTLFSGNPAFAVACSRGPVLAPELTAGGLPPGPGAVDVVVLQACRISAMATRGKRPKGHFGVMLMEK